VLLICIEFVYLYFPVLFVSIGQVIVCEDRLRNDLYCVEWGVKLYSNQPTNQQTKRVYDATDAAQRVARVRRRPLQLVVCERRRRRSGGAALVNARHALSLSLPAAQ